MLTTEPRITINGVELSPGQAATVRVAIESFATDMWATQSPLGADRHGVKMTENYRRAIDDIRQMIHAPK